MDFCIMCVGKIKDAFYRDEIEEHIAYIRKCNHKIQILEFQDEKIPSNLQEKHIEQFLEKECEGIKKNITGKDYVIALCIEGKELSTKQHKDVVKKAFENEYSRIVYVIGGSLGLTQSIKKRANLKLSISKMTFPHQMMRMVLCEEICTMIS